MKGNSRGRVLARRPRIWALGAVLAALVSLAAATGANAAAPPLQPIDPQNFTWQDDLSWADYHALPGTDYSDPSIQPSIKKWKVALVVTDFSDKPFTLSQPVGGTVFGNPTSLAHDIPRAQVPAFLRDFLNAPSALNHFQTMNRYWMEDTYGKYGVQLDVYGPYQLPGKSWQYFAQDFAPASGAGTGCVTLTVTPCNKNFRTDTLAAWQAAAGSTVQSQYDNTFYVSPGQDESGTWQEFGNMLWTQDTVPESFGPHAYDPTLPNWMRTRYVPWTSWASGESIWPNASSSGGIPNSIEAESSGMATYAHELTHNLGIGDNYNNPYGIPVQRSATGPWDMMSRGSFNGAGGPHTRYQIPPVQGSSLGSQHNIRNKLKLGFLTNANVLRLNRNGLATTGMIVAKVKAREAAPLANELSGVTVALDGSSPVDKDPTCTNTTANPNPLCSTPAFTGESVEVVQQIGSDSFDPGHGVLLSKTKTSESSSCGQFTCFVWIIDSHPPDINRVDFVDGQGVSQPVSIGDMRQLDDASFNAGTNSGSSYEYEDTPNRLHYYIIDKSTDAQGVTSYTVGIKNLDGAGPQTRGVSVDSAPPHTDVLGSTATCTFPLTNTGAAAATSTTAHPQGDVSQWVNGDVYRLSTNATGSGWHAQLWSALTTAQFGQSVSVPVYVTRDAGSSPSSSVSLTATSESDSSKTATATCAVSVPQPTVSYTLTPATPNGSNGWWLGPVFVDWTAANADSSTGCADTNVTADGVTALTCSATNDGGTTSVTATVKVDQNNPVTTATLSPGLHNGWYASPTLTLAGDDGTGSGIDRILYSLDGHAQLTYSGPLSGFSTGNHFIQFHATDNAGRVEATKLLAFKVDAVKPTVNVTAPAEGAVIPLDKVTNAKFKCTDNQSGLDTCVGTVANGAHLDTSTVGSHTFTVTGTDRAGNTTTVTRHYQVVYTWNGFFSPVTNTETSKLNLVHAGDLIKIGFGLNGDRGLTPFAAGFPDSVAVSCPSWTPHTVPAAGAGALSGLAFGVASGHYTYGWQTQAGWANACRKFELKLNDGTTTVHSATFMFFS